MSKRRADSRAGMVVTNVALPDEMHRRLAFAAVEERAALTELVRQAVGEWLDRRDKAERRQVEKAVRRIEQRTKAKERESSTGDDETGGSGGKPGGR